MATPTTQLERISGLVDRLAPVSNKQRGMRIEAQEWNTLVEVLLGVLQLDRLQEQRAENLLDQRFATKDHEHLGQVNLTWLDADLQTRLGGGDNSIATRQLLAEMDQKIKSLSDQVSRLTVALENSQRVLDDTIVSDADKTKKILDFERRFKGIEDLRASVTTLSNEVGSVRVNVDKVLELRRSLQDPAGAPINVLQLKQDVTDLQSIRENLNGVDGRPLRMRDLEIRLQEVADVVGTSGTGGLERRFATFSVAVEEKLDRRAQELIAGAKEELLAEQAASETRLRGEIQTSSTQTRDAVTQQFSAQIATLTTTFNETLNSRLNDISVSVTKDALNEAKSLVNARLAEVPDQVRAQLEAAITALRGSLTTSLQDAIGATLATQIRDAETRLGQQIGGVQASTTSLIQAIPGIVSAQIDDALPEIQNALNQQVASQVATARTAIEAELDSRVATAVSGSLQNLDSRISAAVQQQTANIDANIATAVSAATRNIPDQVADEVKLQVAAANLDGKIQDSARSVTTQLRSELKSALADQDLRASNAVQSAVTLMQGQLSAAVAAAEKAAKDFSADQIKSLRIEMTDFVERKTRTTREGVLIEVDSLLRTTHDAITTRFDSQIRTVNDSLSTRLKSIETRFRRIGGG